MSNIKWTINEAIESFTFVKEFDAFFSDTDFKVSILNLKKKNKKFLHDLEKRLTDWYTWPKLSKSGTM